jgi:hypothetical protein
MNRNTSCMNIDFFRKKNKVPYVLGYKSRNFAQNLGNIFSIRLICKYGPRNRPNVCKPLIKEVKSKI